MRKIEKEMLAAIKQRRDWCKANTGVFIEYRGPPSLGPRAEIYLHGQHIADYWYKSDTLDVCAKTLSRFPTNTTKSRLRALGARVFTKDFVTYLDGVAV